MTIESNEQKIIDKVQKLLNMANDASSPNEAMIAAKKARLLMDKHQLSVEDIENSIGVQFQQTESTVNKTIREKWLIQLVAAIGKLNDCVAGYRYDGVKVIYLFQGFKADAIVSKLTMDYVVNICINTAKNSNLSGRSEHNMFKRGFADSIKDKCDEILNERNVNMVTETGTSLIPLKLEMVTAHFGQLKSYTPPSDTRKPNKQELDAYQHGVETGNKTNLDAQITGKESIKITK